MRPRKTGVDASAAIPLSPSPRILMESVMYLLYHLRENIQDARRLGPRFLLRHLSRLRRGDGAPVRVTVGGVGRLILRKDSRDLGVIREIFREDVYRIPSIPHDRYVAEVYRSLLEQGRRPMIIDAGANNGASAAWFAVRYPRALIIAVEPDPGNAHAARANTAQFGVQVVEAAIGSRSGRVRLLTDRPSDAVQTVRGDDGGVRVVTVPEIVAEQQAGCALFIVKVDIEGFESDLFAQDTGWVGDTSVLYVEPHDYMFPGRGVTRGMQAAAVEHDLELLVARGNLVYINRAAGPGPAADGG